MKTLSVCLHACTPTCCSSVQRELASENNAHAHATNKWATETNFWVLIFFWVAPNYIALLLVPASSRLLRGHETELWREGRRKLVHTKGTLQSGAHKAHGWGSKKLFFTVLFAYSRGNAKLPERANFSQPDFCPQKVLAQHAGKPHTLFFYSYARKKEW